MLYVSPVASHARVLPHENPYTTNDMATVHADDAGLQAVTVALMAESEFADVEFFRFDEFANECGMEPWIRCDGVDPRMDGASVDIWTVSGRCIEDVLPVERVFVKKTTLVPILLERAMVA
jgi:hypothetical protein